MNQGSKFPDTTITTLKEAVAWWDRIRDRDDPGDTNGYGFFCADKLVEEHGASEPLWVTKAREVIRTEPA